MPKCFLKCLPKKRRFINASARVEYPNPKRKRGAISQVPHSSLDLKLVVFMRPRVRWIQLTEKGLRVVNQIVAPVLFGLLIVSVALPQSPDLEKCREDR